MAFFTSQKWVLMVVIAVFILTGVVYRERVYDFLTFSDNESNIRPGQEITEISAPPADSPRPENAEKASDTGKEKESGEEPPGGIAGIPAYRGRDPKEARPAAEEVKLFSEEQKQKIYGSIRNYGEAVEEDPRFFFGWIQIGILKKIIGDFEGARDAWEYAGVIAPKNSVSFANLGELYWRYLPDYPRAEADFKTSIKNKPEDVSTYISLSDFYSYSYAAKNDLADDILREGLNFNPGDVNLMKALAALYERDGSIAEAIIWWQKVLEKEPGNTSVAAAIEALKKKQ